MLACLLMLLIICLFVMNKRARELSPMCYNVQHAQAE